MSNSIKQFGLRVITGQERSRSAGLLRGILAVAEPFYATAMRIRNACYERGIFRAHDLGRPTISVGNITTGGTGKTPVVLWLADELRRQGHRPAILLRGYASASSATSDEAQLLDTALNTELGEDRRQKIPVWPDPSRVRGAAEVLRLYPDTTHFILDDGFQHRKARRAFNLVLVNSTEPFGYGHVLPRGLLREPVAGLGRANAILITRCSLVPAEALAAIDRGLADQHPGIEIFHCDHHQSGVRDPVALQVSPMDALSRQNVFLTAGIGDPAAFEQQIRSRGCEVVGTKWFSDHHPFTAADIANLLAMARERKADLILTTEKDWVKMRPNAPADAMPRIGVIQLEIRFQADDAARLARLILNSI